MTAKIWIVRETKSLGIVVFVAVGGLQYLLHGLVAVVALPHHRSNFHYRPFHASLLRPPPGSLPCPIPIDSAELSMNCC
jgi:hypothetical protein